MRTHTRACTHTHTCANLLSCLCLSVNVHMKSRFHQSIRNNIAMTMHECTESIWMSYRYASANKNRTSHARSPNSLSNCCIQSAVVVGTSWKQNGSDLYLVRQTHTHRVHDNNQIAAHTHMTLCFKVLLRENKRTEGWNLMKR